MSRLNVFALLRDQWKFLTHAGNNRPARLLRLLVIILGPVAGGISALLGWRMNTASELVGALGLLAGVFLSAFAVIFSLRVTLQARPSSILKRTSARLMDESALTVLAAALLAGADAIWLGGISATVLADKQMTVLATAITVGLSALVVLYFLLSVRRLHVLYTDAFPPYWRARDIVEGNTVPEPSHEAQKGPFS